MKKIILLSLATLTLASCETTGASTASNVPSVTTESNIQPAAGGTTSSTVITTSQQFGVITAQSSCPDITAAIQGQDSVIAAGTDAETNAKVANAATSVAINGALYSGVLGSVPFLGHGVNAANNINNVRAEGLKTAGQQAQVEKARLVGIYQGKGCQ